MGEDSDVLHEILQHYKAYAEDRMNAIKRSLDKNNVYGAAVSAQHLVEGLDIAGEYLLHPELFVRVHNKETCDVCSKKLE